MGISSRFFAALAVSALRVAGYAWLLLWYTPAAAADPTLNIYCTSIRFSPAGGARFSFELISSPSTGSEPNGELFLLGSDSSTTHGAFIREGGQVPGVNSSAIGSLNLDVPIDLDADQNGLLDFFEVARETPETSTTGAIAHSGLPATAVRASWSRPAGNRFGTCWLSYGNRTFNITFELLNFAGSFPYARNADVAAGPITLTNVGDPAVQWVGQFSFTRLSNDRMNDSATTLTNALGETLSSESTGHYDRFGPVYDGVFVLNDGLLGTTARDYIVWFSRLTEPNDADGDGVPNLSDPDYSGGGRPLSLLIQRTPEGDGIVIAWPDSAPGFVLEVTDRLGSGPWSEVAIAPVHEDGWTKMTVERAEAQRFYRLVKR